MGRAKHFQSAKEPVLNEIGKSAHAVFFLALILWFLALVLGVKPAQASDAYRMVVEIKNQQFDNGKLYFDLYLRQSGEKTIFLGYSDIVLELPVASQPSGIQYVRGSNQFYSATGLYAFGYEQGLFSAVKAEDSLIYTSINLLSPDFSGAADFDLQIARIDQRVNAHRVGRFFIAGVSADFNLNNARLSLVKPGARSVIHSIDPAMGFMMHEVEAVLEVAPPALSNPIWRFDAARRGDGIGMEWNLLTDVREVVVEKSFDGKNWEVLSVSPEEHGGSLFSVTDFDPAGARMLTGEVALSYRLKVMATSGRAYYSPVRQVNYRQGISMVAYPNPVVDQLQLKFEDGEMSSFEVFVVAGNGKVVYQASGAHTSEAVVDLSALAPGQYIVSVVAGQERGVARVVVAR